MGILAAKISQSTCELDAQAIGNALYGLKGMSSECGEVRTLLSVLATKISASKNLLSGQEVGIALYGLRNMSSKYSEVRNVVAAIGQKVLHSEATLSSQSIGMALYGLKEMSSDSKEVREVVGILADKISQSTCELNAQAIGNALYGLKGMNSECGEFRKLLSVLATKISASKNLLSGQEVGMLQNSKSPFNDMVEVADLIEEVRKYVHRARSQVTDKNELSRLWQLAVSYRTKEGMPEKCASSLESIVNDLRPVMSQFAYATASTSSLPKHKNDAASSIRDVDEMSPMLHNGSNKLAIQQSILNTSPLMEWLKNEGKTHDIKSLNASKRDTAVTVDGSEHMKAYFKTNMIGVKAIFKAMKNDYHNPIYDTYKQELAKFIDEDLTHFDHPNIIVDNQ